MIDLGYIRASDGTGEAVRGAVIAARAVDATTLQVDSLSKYPPEFIATVGTLNSEDELTPGTVTVFFGHISDGTIIIDEFAPGYEDLGNTVGQVVLLKPTTPWADTIADALVYATPPVGIINPYAGATAPSGWLLCDGSEVLRDTYQDLYDVIGTTFGAGDGTTTFNVPNLKGRTSVGLDSTQTEFDTLGETGGAKTHIHPLSDQGAAKVTATAAGGTAVWLDRTGTAEEWGREFQINASAGSSSGTSSSGAGLTGNTDNASSLQPYMVLNHIIKT